MTTKAKSKRIGIQSKTLYKRREVEKGSAVSRGKLTLDMIVPGLTAKEKMCERSFFTFMLPGKANSRAVNVDVCYKCNGSELVYDDKEGMVVCSRCGVVQSMGATVGAFSDNTRMIHTSEVTGDMLHVEFGYSDAVRAAVARHPLTAHLSDLAHERIAHLCLTIINKKWQVIVSRTMTGEPAFLITTGAQFAQECTTNPGSEKCVNIILRYLYKGEIVQHMYTKFLIAELKKERTAWIAATESNEQGSS